MREKKGPGTGTRQSEWAAGVPGKKSPGGQEWPESRTLPCSSPAGNSLRAEQTGASAKINSKEWQLQVAGKCCSHCGFS